MDTKTTKTAPAAITTPAKTGGQGGLSTAGFAPSSVPQGLKKRPVGNLPFFRGAPGDTLMGKIVGRNDMLSGYDEDQGKDKYVVYVELECAAPVTQKKDGGDAVESIANPGALINVGVKALTTKSLLQPIGTRVWIKVGEKVKLKNGHTMYQMETADDGPDDDISGDAKALPAPNGAELPQHASSLASLRA